MYLGVMKKLMKLKSMIMDKTVYQYGKCFG